MSVLQLVATNWRAHGEAMCDLIGKVFPNNGYFATRDWARTVYVHHSHYDFAVSRLGFVDDVLVTHYGVWGYRMHIGGAVVRAGGIGAVATNGDYRHRGYMAQTAAASVAAMRAAGYDFSLLFGIDNFYHRFGYVPAWPETTYTVPVEELPTDAPPRLRRFTARAVGVIDDVFNRENATRTGAAVRPTFRKEGFGSWSEEAYRWQLPDGATAGYVHAQTRGNRLLCDECAGDAATVLTVLAHLARRAGCGEVFFQTLPYDSPVARLLRRGTCKVEQSYRRNGAVMVVLLNLRGALEGLTGELSRRLRASALTGYRGTLRIVHHAEAVTLGLADGTVTLLPDADSPNTLTGGDTLARLFLGSDTAEEVITAGDLQTTGDALPLAAILFPAQHPELPMHDRY